MSTAHFHGNNIEVTVYKGFCEVVKEHFHPTFLLLFLTQTRSKYWLIVEMLESDDEHVHSIEIEESDADFFLSEGELTMMTEKEDSDHQHKIHFNIEYRQGLVPDPFNSNIRFIDQEDEDESGEEKKE